MQNTHKGVVETRSFVTKCACACAKVKNEWTDPSPIGGGDP